MAKRNSAVSISTDATTAPSTRSGNALKAGTSGALNTMFASFALNGDQRLSVSNMGDDEDEEIPEIWKDILDRSFKPEHAAEYLKSLSHHLIDLHSFLSLGNDDLNTLGIRIGHRKRFRKVVADAIAQREKTLATMVGPSPSHHRRTHSPSNSQLGNALVTELRSAIANIPHAKLFHNSETDVTWLRVSGEWPSLDLFLADMKSLRINQDFPASFDRLFYNDKPMPFLVLDNSETQLGLLLRIPDLTDERGTSVASITNRLVFMADLDKRVVLTYHNCAVNPLSTFEDDWAKGLFKAKSLPQLLDSAMRRALRSYSAGVFLMREEMDELMAEWYSGSEVDRVQGLTRIQKKAGVYKRCAEANRDAIEQLDALESVATFVKTLGDGLSTVESMSEEVQSNALSSIDLTIAISEFKGSFNLKIFTYMTILLQPVSVATSWYGMNFINMPETFEEDAYYIFIGCVWSGAVVIFALVVFGPDMLAWFQKRFQLGEAHHKQKPVRKSSIQDCPKDDDDPPSAEMKLLVNGAEAAPSSPPAMKKDESGEADALFVSNANVVLNPMEKPPPPERGFSTSVVSPHDDTTTNNADAVEAF